MGNDRRLADPEPPAAMLKAAESRRPRILSPKFINGRQPPVTDEAGVPSENSVEGK